MDAVCKVNIPLEGSRYAYSLRIGEHDAIEGEDSTRPFSSIVSLTVSFDVRHQYRNDVFDGQKSDGRQGDYLVAGTALTRLQFLVQNGQHFVH